MLIVYILLNIMLCKVNINNLSGNIKINKKVGICEKNEGSKTGWLLVSDRKKTKIYLNSEGRRWEKKRDCLIALFAHDNYPSQSVVCDPRPTHPTLF